MGGDDTITQLIHDVKNCLNNIAIANALLQSVEPGEEDIKKLTGEIKVNYTRINEMLKTFQEASSS